MKYWQFLIQQEGDRAWLPLDPNGEILEGRYRVVAHSSRSNVEVNIQISHQFEENGILKQRLQQRSHSSNPEGLVVVTAFTYLQPGLWTLTCSSSDFREPLNDAWLGDAWRESVQLQVLQNVEAFSEWDLADWDLVPQGSSLTAPDAVAKTTAVEDKTPRQPTHLADDGLPPALKQPAKVTLPCLPTFKQPARSLSFKVSAGQVFPPQLCKSGSPDSVRVPKLPIIPQNQTGMTATGGALAYLAERMGATLQSDIPTFSEQATSAATSFEALNLKKRFWSTLNALVDQSDLTR